MAEDKKPSTEIMGKTVVTKEGKNLGEVKDITFETRTGELVQIMLKNPTKYAEKLGLEKDEQKFFIIPYNTIIAVGDFVVIAEEDVI